MPTVYRLVKVKRERERSATRALISNGAGGLEKTDPPIFRNASGLEVGCLSIYDSGIYMFV